MKRSHASFSCMVVFTMYLACDMGLHYFTFMGTNLENRKALTPVQRMNSASMNSMNIMDNVGIFSERVVMNSIFNE